MKKEMTDVEKYDFEVSFMRHRPNQLSAIEAKALEHVEREYLSRDTLGYFPGAAMAINMIRQTGKKLPHSRR